VIASRRGYDPSPWDSGAQQSIECTPSFKTASIL
jgi:hypothetical protein